MVEGDLVVLSAEEPCGQYETDCSNDYTSNLQ